MMNALSIWINHLQLSRKLNHHFAEAENMAKSLENSAEAENMTEPKDSSAQKQAPY